MGGEQGNVRTLTQLQQSIRGLLTVGHHQHRGLECDDAIDPSGAILRGPPGQVAHLALTQHLQAIGVYVVQVADQIGARAGGTHRDLVKASLRGLQARDPLPLEPLAELLKQDIGADDGGLQTGRPFQARWAELQASIMRCRSA